MAGSKNDVVEVEATSSKASGDIKLLVDLVAFLGRRGHPILDLNFKVLWGGLRLVCIQIQDT